MAELPASSLEAPTIIQVIYCRSFTNQTFRFNTQVSIYGPVGNVQCFCRTARRVIYLFVASCSKAWYIEIALSIADSQTSISPAKGVFQTHMRLTPQARSSLLVLEGLHVTRIARPLTFVHPCPPLGVSCRIITTKSAGS